MYIMRYAFRKRGNTSVTANISREPCLPTRTLVVMERVRFHGRIQEFRSGGMVVRGRHPDRGKGCQNLSGGRRYSRLGCEADGKRHFKGAVGSIGGTSAPLAFPPGSAYVSLTWLVRKYSSTLFLLCVSQVN